MNNHSQRRKNIYLAQEGLFSLSARLVLFGLIFSLIFAGTLFQHASLILPSLFPENINTPLAEKSRFQDPCGITENYTRGSIFDSQGKILALNRNSFDLYIKKNNLPIKGALSLTTKLSSLIQGLNTEKAIQALTGGKKDRIVKSRTLREDLNLIEGLPVTDPLKQLLYWKENEPIHTRYYPKGNLTGHIVGRVTLPFSKQQLTSSSPHYDTPSTHYFKEDQLYGITGIEKENDCLLREGKSLHTTIDTRIQTILKDTLRSTRQEFNAKQAGALLMDIHSGHILALASLPDFNPNHTRYIGPPPFRNIITQQRFEIGSIFKIITFAIAFEYNALSFSQQFPTQPLRAPAGIIKDYRPKKKILSLQEVFTHSSNTGATLLSRSIPQDFYSEKLKRFGVLTPPKTLGIPPLKNTQHSFSSPLTPNQRDYISHGYGLEMTPLHLTSVIASLLNGGHPLTPTLLNNDTPPPSHTLLSPPSLKALHYLLAKNVIEGTGKAAFIHNLPIGGKTGSANKLNTKKDKLGKTVQFYDNEKRIASFLALFPMHKPQYILFFIFDEPRPKTTNGFATGGVVAAPAARKTILRIRSLLNIKPIPPPFVTTAKLSIPQEFK